MKAAIALISIVLCAAGCNPPASNPAPAPTPPMANAQPTEPQIAMPSATELKEAALTLSGLKSAYETTKAAYEKHPKDKSARNAYIDAATKYGHESMMSPVLEPRVKYKQALHIYRDVLKLDPNNKVAKPESELIIKIYQSMNRPVPQ